MDQNAVNAIVNLTNAVQMMKPVILEAQSVSRECGYTSLLMVSHHLEVVMDSFVEEATEVLSK